MALEKTISALLSAALIAGAAEAEAARRKPAQRRQKAQHARPAQATHKPLLDLASEFQTSLYKAQGSLFGTDECENPKRAAAYNEALRAESPLLYFYGSKCTGECSNDFRIVYFDSQNNRTIDVDGGASNQPSITVYKGRISVSTPCEGAGIESDPKNAVLKRYESVDKYDSPRPNLPFFDPKHIKKQILVEKPSKKYGWSHPDIDYVDTKEDDDVWEDAYFDGSTGTRYLANSAEAKPIRAAVQEGYRNLLSQARSVLETCAPKQIERTRAYAAQRRAETIAAEQRRIQSIRDRARN